MKSIVAFATSSLILLAAFSARADVPNIIPVQGFLRNAEGVPINDSNLTLQFKLYESEESSEPFWTETQLGITCDRGVFSAYLGTATEIDPLVFVEKAELWLEMFVGSEALGRIRVATVPFAIEAQQCNQVGALTESTIQKAVTDSCEVGSSIRAINSDGTVECASHQPNGALRHVRSVYQDSGIPLTLFCIDIPAQGMLDVTVNISTHRNLSNWLRAGVSKYHIYFARIGDGGFVIESVNKLTDYTQEANMDLSKEIFSFKRTEDRYTFSIDRSATMGPLSMMHTVFVDGVGYKAANFSFSCD